MSFVNNDSNLKAILGPTNTGKTFLAFDRLLSYQSGIFGFPLRLLARENYDRAVQKIGKSKVALITGEEKIFPKDAKYFFCTVESMPSNFEVECIAIDEVQLASDYERGHIFTDRILHSRGTMETIFLGSSTIYYVLKKLFPEINVSSRERFSKLTFSKVQNISKLKPRSAVIAFNINKVYEIAESLRMHKGGAAVVLGSLSPRTRNAQVDVYENKKVNFLVATDAIGMGLNLNINHVSFSSLQKFDGKYKRNLIPAEIGQIAGRAGRFKNDGTFGCTKEIPFIDPKIIQSIENHTFNKIEKIYWRNSNIDFTSISSVLNSLNQFPIKNFYIHKKNAIDEVSFRTLSEDNDIKIYLTNELNVRLLWDVCRIPDFQKIFFDSYLELLKNIFLVLMNNNLKIPEDWLNNKVFPLENYNGGIEELTSKVSNIRTWTYISNQSLWLENNDYWKGKTRNIEDNLSDKLHESLTNRFVDSTASYFVKDSQTDSEPIIAVSSDNFIKLNGQNYGYINGFDLKLMNKEISSSLFSLKHVKKSIRLMIKEKIDNFLNAPDESLNLGEIRNLLIKDNVNIYWGKESVGFLTKGENIFSPKVEVINSEFLDSEKKILINNKLQKWINNEITNNLKPINQELDESAQSNLRSITFNLYKSLGTMFIKEYQDEIKNFNETNKALISKMGIRTGAKFFFIPNLLKKKAIEMKALLWKIFYSSSVSFPYPLPTDGRVSFIADKKIEDTYWMAIGYICINDFAVRVDVFEKIFYLARKKIKSGPFIESSDMMNPIGCNSDQLANILDYCGFANSTLGDGKKIFFFQQKKVKKPDKTIKRKSLKNVKNNLSKRKKKVADPNSPFAVLEKLL